ncbi:unnamed protein product, partial [Effrenium voratum]
MMAQLELLVSRQKASAQWPPRLARHRGPQQAAHTNFATNDAIMATHLAGSGGLERRSTASRVSVCAGESAESTDRFLQGLVRSCVEDACHAMLARGQLLHRAGGGSAAMQAYMTSLPLSKRDGHSSSGQFAMFCSEIFQNLERQTGAEAVLESLGEASGEYKSLSTNSKSGEFFFLSNDRKFLIKTVSESEGLLLVRMLPEYQDHIHSLPASLIVRFAGLFSVELPGPNQRYFLIMKSVFDPACEIHSNYDLKGSLYHRKKKDGESTGKDEDWIAAQLRLSVPEVQRRAMLEAHEADVQFLKSHSVMDYSVLVGIHYPERASSKMTPSTGIVSADGKEVYFVGLIDFLIHFGLKKQAEHLLRAAQGHGDDTSCVDPTDYAARQAKFLRSSVFRAPVALEDDWGTAGRLRVEVLGARNLRNADVVGASDPYVRVSVGLQRAQTPAIQDELNPTWNCSLTLPLNKHHFYDELEFTVWDLDSVRVAQGSDDYLGILKVPMAKVWHGDLELKQKLEETPTGELHVKARLDRDPGPSAGYAPAGSAGYAPAANAPARAGAARWEFAVRHGFEGFDPRCQQTLEECYQRFLAGGASAVQVTSGRAQVTVDFRAMTHRLSAGHELGMRGLVFNAPRRERRETCDGLKLGGCCGALCAFLGAEARAHRQMVPVALAQLLLLADQPLLPANLSAVAKDFGFDDQQRDELLGGVVAVVFFTSGALSSLTAGYLADLVRRTTMISTCTLLGAAGSFSNAWVSTFAALLVCRACVGAAFGGLIPASYAIIGDLYPPEERPHAIAVLLLISGLGLSLGQALANCGWRFAFGLVGSLGLCLGLALLLLMQEPSHTRKDGAGGSLTALRLAMCKNTVLLLCLQATWT